MRRDKEVFDDIFRKAVEWMADCPEGNRRSVGKGVEQTYVAFHLTYIDYTTMRIRHYNLMLLMDGEYRLNNGNGEYVPCADPMGTFDAFVKDCIKARGDD